jgi:hypothetical protein
MSFRPGARAAASALAAASVVYLGPLAFSTGAAAASADTTCSDLVIGVGGNGQRSVDERGLPSMMGAHLDAAAADGNRVENIDYKSSVWPTGAYTKDESVADGKAKLEAAIAEYRAECPDGHVTVIGHSLGAEFADESSADTVILYGDPRRVGGVYDALPGVYPGTSNPGPREVGPNTVDVCHEFDASCDLPAPWVDPAKFAQGIGGYLLGWHAYAPGEADGLEPGDHLIDEPAPLPWLPESTPTGLPAAPQFSLPAWEPGPLPSIEDLYPLIDAFTPEPYHPTPLSDYTPEWLDPILPPEIRDFVPPPLPF